MPCDSSHMESNPKEVTISRLYCFLGELKGRKWKKAEYDGYHRDVYNKGLSEGTADIAADQLCTALKGIAPEQIQKFSLELQMWWRDHKQADKARAQKARKAYHDQLVALLKEKDALQIRIAQHRLRMKTLEIE